MPLDAEDPDTVTSLAALREIYPPPTGVALRKHLDRLDGHCREFLARTPFAMLATANAAGDCDSSPRGGPPGFLQVADDHHVLIPDAPGNRRIDSLTNLIENPRLALCCFVPRYGEVLRLSGTGRISRNAALRERCAIFGRPAATVIVLRVEDAFLHCAKAVKRSFLWEPERWPEQPGLPRAAEIWRDHTGGHFPDAEAIQQLLDESYTKRLY